MSIDLWINLTKDMNLKDWITALGVIVVVPGWIISHHLNMKRDRENDRRKIQIPIFHDLYLEILRITSSQKGLGEISDGQFYEYWKGLMNVQILGTKEQIEMAKRIIEDSTIEGKSVDMEPLISSLRRTLRVLLELPEVNGNINWFHKKKLAKDFSQSWGAEYRIPK
ncbi:hypothetical protein [Ralstonia pseudosolanacearum]|uniref:hypothetical protein n=1 Tax=Ralstonia pseudosolanacearum TaxID=1310165 RepID=UPI0012DA0BF5|nr:hypothetical protein [Ralstonia pseudosolanacearum]MDC6293984.1 hypothetical protein [Ralstonia pseudosolanacearum]MDD7788881.1 hypothetical protein [Ralstonia pseudosolanacearum]MDN3370088.1 hypothetical protein [Ralstonia pseudosolanacearum]QOK87737.1 hypothetical protein HF907_14490 [Ralstonia pseudosolanacearum]